MNFILEVLFYLALTLFLEFLVAMALGYYNKLFIKILIVINLITSPIFTIIVYLYKHNVNWNISILLLLLLQAIIIYLEFFIYNRFLKNKYKIKELLFSVFLMNAFTFVIYSFLQDVFDYLDMFQ